LALSDPHTEIDSVHTWYETVDEGDTRSRWGYTDPTDIPLPEDIQVFTCGPLPFMRLVRSTLLEREVPAARIRYEVFGPDLWAAQTSPDSGN
jgi:nitric oxide dioxygenase